MGGIAKKSRAPGAATTSPPPLAPVEPRKPVTRNAVLDLAQRTLLAAKNGKETQNAETGALQSATFNEEAEARDLAEGVTDDELRKRRQARLARTTVLGQAAEYQPVGSGSDGG